MLLQGTVSFTGSTSATVVIGATLSSSAYQVSLSMSASATAPPWVTAKTITTFTINFASAYTGSVDWILDAGGDVMISALPAGATPAGTELIPSVQSGATVSLTAAQIAAQVTLSGLGGTTAAAALAAAESAITLASLGGTTAAAALAAAEAAIDGPYIAAAASPVTSAPVLNSLIRTAAEIAAGVTPTNYAYDPAGLQMLKRYGQNGTSGPDTAALTSALAVANGSGVVYVPADYAGTNPSSLAAGVTVIDYRVGGAFPAGTDLLGGGRWINVGGNPEGSVAGFHTQQWVTSPSETTSAILGTNKVTGNLSAGGGSMASGTFELGTYGALTGVGGNIVQALTGQIAIRSTGQTLPLVVGVEAGGGIDRSSATTNITTWVSVQGDAVVNDSTSGATITNAYGGRFFQSTASGITNNNFAISSEGDCMFRVGDSLRVENGSGLATIALTFTSNTLLSIPAGVDFALASALGINGSTPPAQPTGYGTPTGGSHQGSFAAGSITLPNLAAAVAQLIVDLKAYGLLGP